VNKRLEELARHKQSLIERCDREREELAVLCASFRLPLAGTSIGFLLGKTLKASPLLIAAAAGLLASRAHLLTRSVRGIGGTTRWWRAAYPPWSWWSGLRRGK
jgi:hypothetical protein